MSEPAKGFSTPQDFLSVAELFDLGFLPTEQPHPETSSFSELARTDLREALELYRRCELQAVERVPDTINLLERLATSIRHTWRNGGTVFMVGCGATGRLVSVLESEHRQKIGSTRSPVVALLAGADYALVRSIENFEDHPEYGERQLHEAGLTANDLVIGVSEGGETPFVLGAVQAAAELTLAKTWFLFCNPEHLLRRVARSAQILNHPNVVSISIETGPMVILGSTRLQASTALQLALLWCLEEAQSPGQTDSISEYIEFLSHTSFDLLIPLIQIEADQLSRGQLCLHESRGLGLTVLTDTTERSPTFSLTPFENQIVDQKSLAPTYLHQLGASDAAEAWSLILHRPIRALNWEGFAERFGDASVLGFDFSLSALTRRTIEAQSRDHALLRIGVHATNEGLILTAGPQSVQSLLTGHRGLDVLATKTLLNAWSTCTMSLCGRVQGNLMTHVRPTNGKLIDRACRLLATRLEQEKIPPQSKAHLVETLLEVRQEIDSSLELRQESVVERSLLRFRSQD
jgi:N-acetylmuramic acid 6-phosphate etherase